MIVRWVYFFDIIRDYPIGFEKGERGNGDAIVFLQSTLNREEKRATFSMSRQVDSTDKRPEKSFPRETSAFHSYLCGKKRDFYWKYRHGC